MILRSANRFFQCIDTTLKGVDSGIWVGIVCERHLNNVSGEIIIEIIVAYILTERRSFRTSRPNVGSMRKH